MEKTEVLPHSLGMVVSAVSYSICLKKKNTTHDLFNLYFFIPYNIKSKTSQYICIQ